MTAHIIRADARNLPLPDDSVDLIVTSPPYFALRSYTDGGEHYTGQVGGEATPGEFVDALLAATREGMRVLKPSGSIWVNLGDKYANKYGGPSGQRSEIRSQGGQAVAAGRTDLRGGAVREKSLLGIPWRYALRCIDELGLILRAEVIWSKPNGLPESVTDRVRRSHETWFHFTKSPKYYSAVDEIREPHSAHMLKYNGASGGTGRDPSQSPRLATATAHPLGKLPGSVWTIATQPLKVPADLGVDHFAAFPMEWPRRLIRGWSPAGVCTACGEGRRPVATPTGERGREPGGRTRPEKPTYTNLSTAALVVRTITGYVCACTPYTDHKGTKGNRPTEHARSGALGNGVRDNPGGGYGNAERTGPWREYHFGEWQAPPTTPGVVLDPFGGTGTTALVADALGRHGISVDMSADYCRLAQWRTTDPAQQAKAARRRGKKRPPRARSDQPALFNLPGGER